MTAIFRSIVITSIVAMAVFLTCATPIAAQTYDWSGAYVGVNAGGVWAHDDQSGTADRTGFAPLSVFNIDAAAQNSLNSRGFTGGCQAGLNWQTENIVWGIEIDAGSLRHDVSRLQDQIPGQLPGNTLFQRSKTEYFTTVRPRIGLSQHHALLYITGGLVALTVKTLDAHNALLGGPNSVSWSTVRSRWIVGGGLEYALGDNWSAKVEYLYTDIGMVTAIEPAFAGSPNTDIAFTHHLVDQVMRIGVNYRFTSAQIMSWGTSR